NVESSILQQILDYLDEDELQIMGLICQRFNFHAYTALLDRHTSTTFDVHLKKHVAITFPKDRAMLSVLELSFFPLRLGSFSCTFFEQEPEAGEIFSADLLQRVPVQLALTRTSYAKPSVAVH
ncbi:hypothetical protein H0H92_001792, partial [Tricholoma furcatifolium]